ncbi:hypothetical protein NDU88_002813 [Pleurodeles waltl]|uniref:Uncharacterized protein n=1 Tax=Pleurodeles waltl TaxID=8319 RepID=A0AAV7M1R3_PLEWA|nr:hypothetical protein NDU88_002813 [Pleurodeles waltl]
MLPRKRVFGMAALRKKGRARLPYKTFSLGDEHSPRARLRDPLTRGHASQQTKPSSPFVLLCSTCPSA